LDRAKKKNTSGGGAIGVKKKVNGGVNRLGQPRPQTKSKKKNPKKRETGKSPPTQNRATRREGTSKKKKKGWDKMKKKSERGNASYQFI